MRSSWLYANGLTTGEISAHFAQIYADSVSKETVSRITDKVLEEMATWRAPPLEVNAAIFIDAIRLLGMVKVRDGQVANRRICAAIEVTLAGEKDILGCGPALVVRARSSPMCVLTDIRNGGTKDTSFLVCDGLKDCPRWRERV
jgi:transposase-like protein